MNLLQVVCGLCEISWTGKPSEQTLDAFDNLVTLGTTIERRHEWRVMKAGCLMAVDHASYKMAVNMIVSDDEQGISEMQRQNRIKITGASEEVIVVKVHALLGLCEVRLKGSTTTMWTDLNFLA